MVEQKNMLKKIWQKPELQVICRGTSEENVLDACKIGHTGGPFSGNCMYRPDGDGWHAHKEPCKARSNS